MTNHMKICLYIVMAAAIVLILVCALNYMHLGSELHLYEQQLADSRAVWEKIAAEKEELQVDLKSKQKQLKEAHLSLDESTERITELKSEIEQLQKEIDILKNTAGL